MKQTLFYIPKEIAEIPVFGFGWALALWVLVSVITLLAQTRGNPTREKGWNSETSGLLQFQLLVGVAIAFLLPWLETPFGLPIRGYGMLMLLGVMAGISTAVYRGRQVGIEPERIYSLLIWFFVAGIGGARLFFVIQYFDSFQRETWGATIREVFRFTEGGLVVFGALIGAAVAFLIFTHRYRIPRLELADVIAPSLLIGLALGRLGCLLNGCCYGGVCETGPWAITFPQFSAPEKSTLSPPYQDQWMSGYLHGFRLGENAEGRVIVAEVVPESPAAEAGLKTGIELKSLNGRPVRTANEAGRTLLRGGPDIALIGKDGNAYTWSIGQMPSRSGPVHPSQIYSSINAFLIFLIGWFYFPLRRRSGEVFGIVMTLYPITRFLLEIVRIDEVGRFGTDLSISQFVSLGVLAAMIGYWYYVRTTARSTPSHGP